MIRIIRPVPRPTMLKVVDVDWKFGVTAASSEDNQLGTTYLHIKFMVESGDGKVENVFMEMTLAQFYDFLHQLEKAKEMAEWSNTLLSYNIRLPKTGKSGFDPSQAH
uniref:(California timema) hypothetical protein n=1 Tax=Timema californicum TaxID=61474 RepID=A0A7R9JBP4_TIMCA|nr:unnamed protein product [Timema californicum]